jgi:hypothetical protein
LAAQQWDNSAAFPADIHFLSVPVLISSKRSSMLQLRRDGGAGLPLLQLFSVLAVATASLLGCVKMSTPLNPPEAPSITSANSTTCTEGTAGSFPVAVTGTPPPTITESGALPDGVTFSGFLLSGTPTETGTFPLVFTAKNGVLPNATQNFTLTVNP